MKLEHKISKTTELSSDVIIEKLFAMINRRNYGILDFDKTRVSFDDRTGGFIGRGESLRRLKSGEFKIMSNDSNNVVVFEYLPIPVFEYIFVIAVSLIIILIGIINKDYRICLISLPFIGQLIFKYFNLKKIANEILNEIVTQ
jgi:hypothetical protein